MEYTIDNGTLAVTISSMGAQMLSIRKDGKEYMWQRDSRYWGDCAPNIFPYVARLTDGKYTVDGQTYEMGTHGFIRRRELEPEKRAETSVTFRLDSDADTEKQYPWRFRYRLTYELDHSSLNVENRDETTMYFGIGGHPGFFVPISDGYQFEDYYVEFPDAEQPVRIGFTDTCFRNGMDRAYPLDEKNRIFLRHELFDDDAIVLAGVGHRVTVDFPDYPYFGLWHRPKTDAPYVCLEPWSSLPARDGVIEDFARQKDLVALEAGRTYQSRWTVTISPDPAL